MIHGIPMNRPLWIWLAVCAAAAVGSCTQAQAQNAKDPSPRCAKGSTVLTCAVAASVAGENCQQQLSKASQMLVGFAINTEGQAAWGEEEKHQRKQWNTGALLTSENVSPSTRDKRNSICGWLTNEGWLEKTQ